MANILEMPKRIPSEIWDPGVLVTYIWGAFDLLVLRSFGVK